MQSVAAKPVSLIVDPARGFLPAGNNNNRATNNANRWRARA